MLKTFKFLSRWLRLHSTSLTHQSLSLEFGLALFFLLHLAAFFGQSSLRLLLARTGTGSGTGNGDGGSDGNCDGGSDGNGTGDGGSDVALAMAVAMAMAVAVAMAMHWRWR